MAYTTTTRLGLQKAVANTNQAFETSVFNSNLDLIDAEAVAVDARLDAVEANDWVTSARIAANAVGASEIAAGAVGESELASGAVTSAKIAAGAVGSTEIAGGGVIGFNIANGAVDEAQLSSDLNLRDKNVFVSTYAVGTGSDRVASTAYAENVVYNLIDDRVLPEKFAWFTVTGTTGSTGLLTVDLTSRGFGVAPVVTVSIVAPSATAGNPFHVGLNAAPTATSVVFKVQDHAGAVCNTKSVTVHVIALAGTA